MVDLQSAKTAKDTFHAKVLQLQEDLETSMCEAKRAVEELKLSLVEKDATLTKLEILCGSYEEKARDYREKSERLLSELEECVSQRTKLENECASEKARYEGLIRAQQADQERLRCEFEAVRKEFEEANAILLQQKETLEPGSTAAQLSHYLELKDMSITKMYSELARLTEVSAAKEYLQLRHIAAVSSRLNDNTGERWPSTRGV
ncbi:non-neuronal cytoplasmic intermediate filament protein B-like [Zophobas morio]|uniref:non-neuronal cytoplasmic intermediate filament protein B-like n=1 Tax=Zophobas morio TaxID=2755281 RepID=UPI003082CD20